MPSSESAQPRQAPSFVGAADQHPAYFTEDEHQNPMVAPTLALGPPAQTTEDEVTEQSTRLPVPVEEAPVPAVPWTPDQPRLAPYVTAVDVSDRVSEADHNPGMFSLLMLLVQWQPYFT